MKYELTLHKLHNDIAGLPIAPAADRNKLGRFSGSRTQHLALVIMSRGEDESSFLNKPG